MAPLINKLNATQVRRRDALVAKMEAALKKRNKAVAKLNAAFAKLEPEIERTTAEYNRFVHQADHFTHAIASKIGDHSDKQSRSWKESEDGAAHLRWELDWSDYYTQASMLDVNERVPFEPSNDSAIKALVALPLSPARPERG